MCIYNELNLNALEGNLVSSCFNINKQLGIHDVAIGDRTICEAIV